MICRFVDLLNGMTERVMDGEMVTNCKSANHQVIRSLNQQIWS